MSILDALMWTGLAIILMAAGHSLLDRWVDRYIGVDRKAKGVGKDDV